MPVSKKYNKTKKEIKVTFKVTKKAAQGAKEIYLLCENNGWDPIPMECQKSGDFKVDVPFSESDSKTEFQYRFRLVMEDGTEMYDNDWDADKYVPNPFEGDNSVVILTKDLKMPEPTPAAATDDAPAPAKTKRTCCRKKATKE